MKTITLLATMTLFIVAATAQSTDASPAPTAQSIFLEIGANGILFSANYDTRFGHREDGAGMRVGVGFFGGSDEGVLTVPVGVNYLAGKSPNFFEGGLGYTYATFTSSDGFFSGDGHLLFPSAGYRYQQLGKGIIVRIVISPAIDLGSGSWLFFGGVGVGYKFR